MPAAHIRRYEPRDLDALYEICRRTGHAGEDASHLVEDPRLLGEVYAGPYAALEPELAFVVDDGRGRAIGYVLGALDTRRFEAACERAWWPVLRERHPRRGGGSLDDLLVEMIHAPRRQHPAVVATHPSHLHVDLLPEAQGAGWGRRLLERLFQELHGRGSPAVHLGVAEANARAIGFYEHLGFEQLRADGLTRTLGRALP